MVDRTVNVLNSNWATFLPPLQTLPPVLDSRHCAQELEVRVGWARFLQKPTADAQQNEHRMSGADGDAQRVATLKRNLNEDELAGGNWLYTGFSSCNGVKEFMEHLERIEKMNQPFAVSDWEYSEDCFYDAVSSLLPLAGDVLVSDATTECADAAAASFPGDRADGQVTKRQLEAALKRSRLRQTMGDSFSVVSFPDADEEGRRWFCDWMFSNKRTQIVSKHQIDATMWTRTPSNAPSSEPRHLCSASNVTLKTHVLDSVQCAKFRSHLCDFHLQWSIETQLANVSFSRLPVATDPKSPSSSTLSAPRQLKLCHHGITTTRIKRRKSLFFSLSQIRRLLYSVDERQQQQPAYESDVDRVKDMFTPAWRVDFTVCWRSSLPNGQSLQAARREAANFAVDALSAALVQPSYEIELECMCVADETERITQLALAQSPGAQDPSALQQDSTGALVQQAFYLSKLLFLPSDVPWGARDYKTVRVR